MAYSVQGTTIRLTRGDSMTLDVKLYDGDAPYIPVSTDSIRFALKHSRLNVAGTDYQDQNPLITKTIPYDTMTLSFVPLDTKSLGFGSYEYDIEITHGDGTVDTFITASPFIITREVH